MFEQLRKEKEYLVGVSGGCDSMALLDMLVQAGFKVVAVHINYFLRFDSILDEMTVRAYCLEQGIPNESLQVAKADYAKGNFQSGARKIRYRFYAKIAAKYGADTIILGHHLDDQYETIAMQKERGFAGFMGISSHSEVAGLKVVRPLLKTTKQTLRQYCHDHDVYYRDDYTNFETEFTRDRIRNHLMPALSEFEKNELLLYRSYFNRQKSNRIAQIQPLMRQFQQQGYLRVEQFTPENYHELLYGILLEYLEAPQINNSLIEEIYRQITSPKPNLKISLTVNYEFIKEYHNVRITTVEDRIRYQETVTEIQDGTFEYFRIAREGPLNYGVAISAQDLPLTIRSPRPGDRIATSGGTKKISRLFIDNKIPATMRKTYPVVLNRNQEIILVPGLAKNMRYMTTKPNVFMLLL